MLQTPTQLADPRLGPLLVCPTCKGDLQGNDDRIECGGCRISFGYEQGVPSFVDVHQIDQEIQDFEATVQNSGISKVTHEKSALREFLLKNPGILGPPIARDHDGGKRWRRLREFFEAEGGIPMNLGSQGNDIWEEMINLDIEYRDAVSFLADAHHMPLAPESLSMVISTSVFEHLQDPVQVTREIHRVLRPGGRVYLEVPWMYEMHGCPMDFQRWTLPGLRTLLKDFEIVDQGCIGGPASVTARMLRGLIFCMTPGRIPRYALRTLATWCLFWMKYIDPWIPEERRIPYAQGYWIWAEKRKP